MTPTSLDCHHARRWLSEARDDEAAEDPRAQEHLSSCAHCASWSATFDCVTRVARLRAPRPSSDLRRQLEGVVGPTPSRTHPLLGARVTLWAAAAGSAAVLVLAAFGVLGHSHLGSPEGRDAEAFLISLTGGYALTAWRPVRLAAGFLPVAVLAAVVTTTMSAVALVSGETSLASEMSHVPILIGAGGAVAAFRATFNPHAPGTTLADLEVRHTAHA